MIDSSMGREYRRSAGGVKGAADHPCPTMGIRIKCGNGSVENVL